MKLYLTQILKEANEFGFAQQPNVNFSAAPTAPQMPVAPAMPPAPAQGGLSMAPSPQAGGMMMPGMSDPNMGQIQIAGPKFTPTI